MRDTRSYRPSDMAFIVLAVSLHGGAGFALLRAKAEGPRPRSLVEVDFRPQRIPEPPQLTPPAPSEPQPEVHKEVHKEVRTRRLAARSLPTASPPAAAPPRPTFGITMDSTTGDSSFSVPLGNTTMADPAHPSRRETPTSTSQQALAGAPGGSASVPAIRSMPEVDEDVCGRSASYPKEALDLGIEGDVRMRIALDQQGRVVEAVVLGGLGHGLDREALNAIKHHCKFTPAFANDGRPVPFVIERYVFHFEIPR